VVELRVDLSQLRKERNTNKLSTPLENISVVLLEKRKNELNTILTQSGSSASTKTTAGVTIVNDSNVASSLVFQKLQSPVYDITELLKSINTNAVEINPNIPELNTNFVQKVTYDNQLLINSNIKNKINEITIIVDQLKSIRDDYTSQIQFEKTQQSLIKSSNNLLATSIKSLKKTIEQFNTQIEEAIQKSLSESIKRTSIVAQNRGFSLEITALLEHINTLNLLIQTINVQIATIETKTQIESEAKAFAAEKNGILVNSVLVVYWDSYTNDSTLPKFWGWGYNNDAKMKWGNSNGRLYFKNFDKENIKINLSPTFNRDKNTLNSSDFINTGPHWFEFGEAPGTVNTIYGAQGIKFGTGTLTSTITAEGEKTIYMKFNPVACNDFDSKGPNGFWGAISNTTTYYGWMEISATRADGFVDTIPSSKTEFAMTKWHQKTKTYAAGGYGG
jgi:hypothetical protein